MQNQLTLSRMGVFIPLYGITRFYGTTKWRWWIWYWSYKVFLNRKVLAEKRKELVGKIW